MVLAAMKIKEWKDQARKEGREEILKEGREKRRKLYDEAFAKFGVEVNGVLMLPWTPEVQRFLSGKSEQ